MGIECNQCISLLDLFFLNRIIFEVYFLHLYTNEYVYYLLNNV